MDDSPKNTGQFGKGNPGKPKGAVNKTTKTLREAILLAAESVGAKKRPNTSDGLVGYLEEIADNHPVAMSTLLGKVLPMTITGPENPDGSDGPVVIKIYAGPKKEE